MNNIVKQIIMGATVVVLTACGGGSSTKDSGVLIKKYTKLSVDKGHLIVDKYTYKSERLSKIETKRYDGGTEDGDYQYKYIVTYKYKNSNISSQVYKNYDANDELTSMMTSAYTVNEDGDIITNKSVYNDYLHSEYNSIIEKNATEFIGPIATKNIETIYYPNTNQRSKTIMKNEALDNKLARRTIYDESENGYSILYKYDSLYRKIEEKNMDYTTIYTYDTDKIRPIPLCFGKSGRHREAKKKKYPKSEEMCNLITTIQVKGNYGSSILTYMHKFNNSGHVTKREVNRDGVLETIETYEY